MSRAKWKGPFVDLCIITLKKKRFMPRLWSRSSVVPGKFAGRVMSVHNGKDFIRVPIDRSKIGYKFGEYSYPRKSRRKKKKPLKKSKLKKIQSKKK